MAQSQSILRDLSEIFPNIEFELIIIKTQGDRVQDQSLSKVEGKGFFTKELEDALLSKEIDLAVHSLKDLPVDPPNGLIVAAIPKRVDAHDILIGSGKRIGTSSLRRQAQLRAMDRELQILDLRGNIDTRLRKLKEGKYDAIVIAMAGLLRLNSPDLNPGNITTLPFKDMLPAPGQGALGIEIRSDDKFLFGIVSKLNDPITVFEVTAERSFLRALGGGCSVPVGAKALVKDGKIELDGLVASLDGKQIIRGKREDKADNAKELGEKLARDLLRRGAGDILCQIRKAG